MIRGEKVADERAPHREYLFWIDSTPDRRYGTFSDGLKVDVAIIGPES
jgi:hypothetical protein